jgi:RNA polymerase sigma factor (sigma-70 family)
MNASASVDLQTVFLEIRPELDDWVGRRYGSTDLAADIVQDIYVRLYRVREPLASRSDARAYLFRMASNAAIDHYKLEARRTVILQSAAPLQEVAVDGPEAAVFVRELVLLIQEAMRELPKHCYPMLILSRVLGLTNGEIAKTMGVSKSLVEKYIAMALIKCRDRVGSL